MIIILVLGLAISPVDIGCIGQGVETPTATWILPGAYFEVSKNTHLALYYGLNDALGLGVFYPQALFRLNRTLTLNPGYMYVERILSNVVYRRDHTLMNALLYHEKIGSFELDNRSLFWTWLPEGSETLQFYRNRLRFFKPFTIQSFNSRIYLAHEFFFLFNSGQLTRNRIGGGLVLEPFKWAAIDLTYYWESNRGNNRLDLFFVTGNFKLNY